MHSKIIAKILLRFTKINKPAYRRQAPPPGRGQTPAFKGAGRIYLLTFRFIKFLYLPMQAGRRNSFYVRGKGRKYLRKRYLPPEADRLSPASSGIVEMTHPHLISPYDKGEADGINAKVLMGR